MAINKVVYQGEILIDLTEDTVTPETLAQGRRAHGKDGQVIIGTSTGESGGESATVTTVGGWEGTPLPTDGQVGTVYYNNNLSPQEVVDLIATTINPNGEGFVGYCVAGSQEYPDVEFIDVQTGLIEGENVVIIMDSCVDVETGDLVEREIFMSGPEMFGFPFQGWNPDVMDFTFNFNVSSSAVYEEYNDQLSSLFSITPFIYSEGEPIQLSDEYDGTPIDLTEKKDIDIKALLDEKKLPLKINFRLDTGSEKLQWKDYYGNVVYTIQGDTLYLYDTAEELLYYDGQNSPWNNEEIKKVCILEGSKYIHTEMFYYCQNLTSVTIPNTVSVIGENAFYKCISLTEVNIPNSVVSIGNQAFGYCTSLTKTTLPNSVTSIGNHVFTSCSNLSEITIPDSVTSIGYGQFSNCDSLTKLTCPGAMLPEISSSGKEQLEKVIITSGETIDEQEFNNCANLTEVILPNSLVSIGNIAFMNCTSLTSIVIPNNVTSIGNQAFDGCTNLTEVTLSNSLISIGNYAFQNCTGLTNIIIPDSVTTFGSGIFDYCENLTSITCPVAALSKLSYRTTQLKNMVITSGDTIEENAFRYHTNLTNLVVSDSVVSLGYNIFSHLGQLETLTCPAVVVNPFSTTSTTIKRKLKKAVITSGDSLRRAFLDSTNLTEVVLPNSLLSINTETFSGCTGLKSITIPNSVTSIGFMAFEGCTGLTNIVIPDSVKTIDAWAFGNCTNLTGIIIPDSVTTLGNEGDVGGNAIFINCTSLKNIIISDCVTFLPRDIFMNCTSLTNIIIPNSVETIKKEAFYGCTGLTNIVIPNSVTSIEYNIFENCTNLTNINYGGTTEQWNAITKGADWDLNTGNYTVHCTDGDIAKA